MKGDIGGDSKSMMLPKGTRQTPEYISGVHAEKKSTIILEVIMMLA